MANEIKVTFTGTRQMASKIRAEAVKFEKRLLQAVTIEGERVMFASKRDYVPVDLGPLRASGHVDPAVRSAFGLGKKISTQLNFGGPAAPYALAVHEHPSDHSPPSWQGVPVVFSPRGRGPKYLEIPLRHARIGFLDRIANTMQGRGAANPRIRGGLT